MIASSTTLFLMLWTIYGVFIPVIGSLACTMPKSSALVPDFSNRVEVE